MIKINQSYTKDFLVRYNNYVFTDKVIPLFRDNVLNAQGITPAEKNRITALFTNAFIHNLIFCNAEQLLQKIQTIYNCLPVLSERYCLEYYLKDINLTTTEAKTEAKSQIGKEEVKRISARVAADLQALSDVRKSILFPTIIENLHAATTPTKIKKILTKIISMKLGNYNLNHAEKAQFPLWVSGFDNVFNYSVMSKMFGYEITTSFGFNICPYCNYEDIETILGNAAASRPDLDHFYPKSKFPFLAVTLSNLIPAGKRCNQDYKKTNSMFDYVHPRINGINQHRLFTFHCMFDDGRNSDKLKIKLINQNNVIDKNLELFNVGEMHNKQDVRDWFIELDEKYQFILNSDSNNIEHTLDDNNLIKMYLYVDVSKSPSKGAYQKLKIDALNFLSGRNYQMAD